MKKNLLKTILVLLPFTLFLLPAFGQTRQGGTSSTGSRTGSSSNASKSDVELDYFLVGGSLGLGPIVSTNLINTGFIGEATVDFIAQIKHHRIGFGITNTLMGTPENLGVLLFSLGKDNVNLHKGYLMYEWTLLKNSPINLAFGAKMGAFTVGNYPDTTKTTFFASVAPVIVELGHPKFFLYVKPELGYNSYNTGSWKKDIYVCVNIGLRAKFNADAEKKKKKKKK